MATQHVEKNFSSNAAENYERFFVPSIGEPVARDLIKQAGLRPGERVLDVACGTGVVTRMASEQVGATGSVAGLDIEKGMLAVARKVSPASIEWYEASAENIPVADTALDVVLCQLGLQFVPDQEKALKEMYRVLMPGGRVLLNVPGPASPMYETLIEALEKYINPQAAGFVRRVFSLHHPHEIRQLMTAAGFSKVSIDTKKKTFTLPAPEDFLWQYVHSTPLMAITANADKDRLSKFEEEVLTSWRDLAQEGHLIDDMNIVVASAHK